MLPRSAPDAAEPSSSSCAAAAAATGYTTQIVRARRVDTGRAPQPAKMLSLEGMLETLRVAHKVAAATPRPPRTTPNIIRRNRVGRNRRAAIPSPRQRQRPLHPRCGPRPSTVAGLHGVAPTGLMSVAADMTLQHSRVHLFTPTPHARRSAAGLRTKAVVGAFPSSPILRTPKDGKPTAFRGLLSGFSRRSRSTSPSPSPSSSANRHKNDDKNNDKGGLDGDGNVVHNEHTLSLAFHRADDETQMRFLNIVFDTICFGQDSIVQVTKEDKKLVDEDGNPRMPDTPAGLDPHECHSRSISGVSTNPTVVRVPASTENLVDEPRSFESCTRRLLEPLQGSDPRNVFRRRCLIWHCMHMNGRRGEGGVWEAYALDNVRLRRRIELLEKELAASKERMSRERVGVERNRHIELVRVDRVVGRLKVRLAETEKMLVRERKDAKKTSAALAALRADAAALRGTVFSLTARLEREEEETDRLRSMLAQARAQAATAEQKVRNLTVSPPVFRILHRMATVAAVAAASSDAVVDGTSAT